MVELLEGGRNINKRADAAGIDVLNLIQINNKPFYFFLEHLHQEFLEFIRIVKIQLSLDVYDINLLIFAYP
jgi:hypothetical protein